MTFINILLVITGTLIARMLWDGGAFLRDKLRDDSGLPPRGAAQAVDDIDALEREFAAVDRAISLLLDKRRTLTLQIAARHGDDFGAGAA